MATIGSIGPYVESEDFETYVDRVEMFFDANSVVNAKKVPTFLSLIGPQVYGLLQNLVSPTKPKDCTYDDLINALKTHYKPKVITIYERFKFYNRKQGQGESIADYVAGIKACAHTCDFGTTLKEMLRDRLVCGIRDEATQRALLTESNLTFDRAVEIATVREAAAKDVQAMGRAPNVLAVGNQIPKKFSSSPSKPKGGKSEVPSKPCSGCGSRHWRRDCPFKEAVCHGCRKRGHIKKMCYNKTKPNSNYQHSKGNVHAHESSATVESSCSCSKSKSAYDDFVYKTESSNNYCPIYVPIKLNDVSTKMELDTGAARSLISQQDYLALWSEDVRPSLKSTSEQLRVYGGNPLPIVGEINVTAKYKSFKPTEITLVVVEDQGPLLMGRDLISKFQVLKTNNDILTIKDNSLAQEMQDKFPGLFSEGLGCFTGYKVSLDVDTSVPTKFCRARPVPYTMKPKLDKALDSLQKDGIISPVPYSPWAAPVVPVLKSDGSIRVCGDYKVTVNKAVKLDSYPIPKLDDLFSSLAGGSIFSKLDMSQAYCQLELDEESKAYTVINTHRGLFRYNRLCFGISSAPGIFQRVVEQLLRGVTGVLCYLDDILITGSNEAEHRARLLEVLTILNNAGFKLRLDKCSFRTPEVSYLGYKIDSAGLHPSSNKVSAIVDAPAPTNVKQLESYLGVINFYRRFIPHASTLLEPLNYLRRADVPWSWGTEQDKAFKQSKEELLNSKALVHFDPKLPLSVSADSSPYGLGAVLNHIIDGQERPICFVSRTLIAAERNYPQLEKEALAIVFALKQFHTYLWGQRFRVVTDHKPLLGLFNPNKIISPMASGRIQRWALMLQAYSFELIHRSGVTLGTADALSRLPLPATNEAIPILGEWIHTVQFLDSSPISADMIRDHTRKDPTLSKVVRYCELGWPTSMEQLDESLLPYFRKRDELSLESGCLLWGSRVVIPNQDRTALLSELHSGHVGASRMKELARSYLWWPKLDSNLEELVRKCSTCLETRKNPPKAELHPWEWPSHPWHRLHVDYAGPVQGKYFLVVVDAHSKWVEIFPTNGPSTSETIKNLRHCFCQFGFPVTVVSDNGPCFTSQDFKTFLTMNGVRHVTTSVYKPASNGLAERMVQTFKSSLASSKENWSVMLDKFLFKYRITPHTTTGVSPSELLFKRKLRCRLDLLHPGDQIGGRVARQQENQRRNYTHAPRQVEITSETPVIVRNYSRGPRWIPATVSEQTGPVSYRCELEDGRIAKRHQDQIVVGGSQSPIKETSIPELQSSTPVINSPDVTADIGESFQNASSPEVPSSPVGPITPKTSVQPHQPKPIIRRSTRVSRPPKRLDL